ncbi:prolipoprotein diacylglyceryl transferase [Shimia sp. CNT1-13L.2]|uniref:prolipoprotein diacylglyceryl transferase n=1 Tax=Shimia sp. CNT1-13L.2 TaxID=2959663 RepID=UPI0020CFD60A|nr:prolipoprotein diacylglyceryl transferase [Shimia sp. CNT1-13L.2]MCP9483754.1 prolipoprotein diacylglyceryl transferase [Shimia sp. CNT1-13L.2]
MRATIPFPDLSPEIFSVSLFGMELALRWYAMAYIVGIVLGWRLVVMALNRSHLWGPHGAPMTVRQCEDLLTWVILGVIAGGRLGYVLFYKPGYYLANPAEIPMVWQGGMAFHGGLLGVIIAAWMWSRKESVARLPLADAMALGVPAGLLLGRIANFINAELWGRPTDLPWAVAFPGYGAQDCGQALGEICARHPSQLYEALLEGLILGAVLIWLAWRRQALQRPGTIAGTFFAGYGLARFLVEFARQPDAQFISEGNPLGLALHIGGYGLTMGQILSIPMILLGLWLVRKARNG